MQIPYQEHVKSYMTKGKLVSNSQRKARSGGAGFEFLNFPSEAEAIVWRSPGDS
jgi:hypothetical protein